MALVTFKQHFENEFTSETQKEKKALGEGQRREDDTGFQISGKTARTKISSWKPQKSA